MYASLEEDKLHKFSTKQLIHEDDIEPYSHSFAFADGNEALLAKAKLEEIEQHLEKNQTRGGMFVVITDDPLINKTVEQTMFMDKTVDE